MPTYRVHVVGQPVLIASRNVHIPIPVSPTFGIFDKQLMAKLGVAVWLIKLLFFLGELSSPLSMPLTGTTI